MSPLRFIGFLWRPAPPVAAANSIFPRFLPNNDLSRWGNLPIRIPSALSCNSYFSLVWSNSLSTKVIKKFRQSSQRLRGNLMNVWLQVFFLLLLLSTNKILCYGCRTSFHYQTYSGKFLIYI